MCPTREPAGIVSVPEALYSLTTFGLDALTEALRQELQPRRVRVSTGEPGTVATDLASHTHEELRPILQAQVASIDNLEPSDIGTSPRRVAVNEALVRSAAQTW